MAGARPRLLGGAMAEKCTKLRWRRSRGLDKCLGLSSYSRPHTLHEQDTVETKIIASNLPIFQN
eukprot:367070-Amphidinium_carterae.1